MTPKDRQGLFIIMGVGLVLLAFFAYKVAQDAQQKVVGPDLCVGLPTRNTVVVLDHSEQIADQTRYEIAVRAWTHIVKNVQLNERLSIFTVSDDSKRSLQPIIQPVCRPREDGNRFTENVELIRKRFKERFEKPVRAALATAPHDTKESPIAQTLTDLSLTEYLRGTSNTLLVFSDMLENTSRFSLYQCASTGDVIERYRQSRQGATERPTFKNTAVILNIIPRLDQSKETLKCRDRLWTWFFGDSTGPNARLAVDHLPGGAPIESANARRGK
jgi:hypothetical protein